LSSPAFSIRQGPRPRRRASSRAVVVALLCLALLGAGQRDARGERARAERVHDLTRALVQGRSVKARVSAAAELDRLRDPRALRALIQALSDRSFLVRQRAAIALGHLGDSTALPALERARRDPRRAVRREVIAAIDLIRERQRALAGRSAASRDARGLASYPRPAPHADQIHVMLKSASDKSEGAPAAVRQTRARRMRSLMVDQIERSKEVMLVPSVSADSSIDPYSIDLTVVKLEQVERGTNVEVECAIRVAISTREGKMLSVLTGGAKVQVPRGTFREQFLPQLRGEALEGAVRSVHRDMVAYLVKSTRPAQPAGSAVGDLGEKHGRE
jgi:hypothetical protein